MEEDETQIGSSSSYFMAHRVYLNNPLSVGLRVPQVLVVICSVFHYYPPWTRFCSVLAFGLNSAT